MLCIRKVDYRKPFVENSNDMVKAWNDDVARGRES